MNRVILRNNLRALGIHFALSVAGILSLFVVQAVLSLVFNLMESSIEPLWFGYAYFLIPVVVGSFVYIVCSYLFLKSVEEKPLLSVSGLAFLTIFVGIIFGIAHIVLDFPVFSEPATLGDAATLLLILFNTLGFGVVTLFLTEGNLPDGALSFIIVLFISILPPTLFYVGLRLKIWRESRQEITKEGVHE